MANDDLAAAVRRAAQLMMEEILANGPAVAVLTLSYADAQRLLAWRGDAVFMPSAPAVNNALIYRHCVSVVGWGSSTGQPFWWVQNSYTAAWGQNGFARIARGTLETTWYAPLAERRPCASVCLTNNGSYGSYNNNQPQPTTTTTPQPTNDNNNNKAQTTTAIGNGWILCIAFGTAGLLTALVSWVAYYYRCYCYDDDPQQELLRW